GAEAHGAAAMPRARSASVRAQRWSEVLFSIVQLASERTGVAPRLLATRNDAEEAACVVDEQGLEAARTLPAFATWRYDVVGRLWEGWPTGTLALVGDATSPGGIGLVAR